MNYALITQPYASEIYARNLGMFQFNLCSPPLPLPPLSEATNAILIEKPCS
jgi:hypothetical protein